MTVAYSEIGVALWTNRYHGNYGDRAQAIAVDHNGNVIVTGSSDGSGGRTDYATVAYSPAGVPLWTNRYSGPGDFNDHANAVAVDGNGNVFVTGTSGDLPFSDYATVAYSAGGVPLWTNRYDAPSRGEDQAVAVAVNSSGNVFVTGYSDADYATIAYSVAGAALWTNRYNTFPAVLTSDFATAMAVDRNGNVFVTGSSDDFDFITTTFATVAYSSAGVPLWTNWYNKPGAFHSVANAIAVDRNGNVFVTGVSLQNSNYDADYATIAYSGAGVALWTNRYDGPINGPDTAMAVAVDGNGTVFVTGVSRGRGTADDYATIAYSGAGMPLWTNRYNGPANGNDEPGVGSCLAIGPDGAVYVTGASDGDYGVFTAYDYATVKYVWHPNLAIQPLVAGSSTVNLNVSGPPNSSWVIERALMITGPWTNLGLSLIGANGSGSFRDVDPSDKGAFYRVIQP